MVIEGGGGVTELLLRKDSYNGDIDDGKENLYRCVAFVCKK